jgi:hypothetical protein
MQKLRCEYCLIFLHFCILTAIRCEFEAELEGDHETTLTSSVVKSNKQSTGLFVRYKISSPEVYMQLSLVEMNGTEILHNALLLSQKSQFLFDDAVIADEYRIVIVVYRSSVAGGSTNEFVEIYSIMHNPVLDEGITVISSCH